MLYILHLGQGEDWTDQEKLDHANCQFALIEAISFDEPSFTLAGEYQNINSKTIETGAKIFLSKSHPEHNYIARGTVSSQQGQRVLIQVQGEVSEESLAVLRNEQFVRVDVEYSNHQLKVQLWALKELTSMLLLPIPELIINGGLETAYIEKGNRHAENLTQGVPIKALRANYDLNESQRKALHTTLCMRISFVQGPPGTGKTQTSLAISEVLGENDLQGLVAAPSNVAADNLLRRLLKGTNQIIRLGCDINNKIAPELVDHSIEALVKPQVGTGKKKALNTKQQDACLCRCRRSWSSLYPIVLKPSAMRIIEWVTASLTRQDKRQSLRLCWQSALLTERDVLFSSETINSYHLRSSHIQQRRTV